MLALELLLAAYLNAGMELTFNGRRIVETKMQKKVWNLQVRRGTWNVVEIDRITMFVCFHSVCIWSIASQWL